MITSWQHVSSKDKVKPESWRMFVAAHLCASGGEPGPQCVNAILDTGSPWSVLTEDFARQFCGIRDVREGQETSVSWPGSSMPAWLHHIKIVVPHGDSPKVTTVLDEFPILCVRSYVRPAHKKPLSMAVFGADFSRNVLAVLNGPEAKVIM